jgi:hypothetical protein
MPSARCRRSGRGRDSAAPKPTARPRAGRRPGSPTRATHVVKGGPCATQPHSGTTPPSYPCSRLPRSTSSRLADRPSRDCGRPRCALTRRAGYLTAGRGRRCLLSVVSSGLVPSLFDAPGNVLRRHPTSSPEHVLKDTKPPLQAQLDGPWSRAGTRPPGVDNAQGRCARPPRTDVASSRRCWRQTASPLTRRNHQAAIRRRPVRGLKPNGVWPWPRRQGP